MDKVNGIADQNSFLTVSRYDILVIIANRKE